MKIKSRLTSFIIVALTASLSWGAISTDTSVKKDPSAGVNTAADCNVASYYPIGVLCQDTDDGKLYKGTGSAVEEITAGGSGTVTKVGDGTCSDGYCLDGSADGGTYIRLYDGTSAYISITAGVRTLTILPSNTSAESLIFTFGNNDNTVTLTSGTGASFSITGLAIGTNVQAYDADLAYLAGFTPTANVKTILNAADNAAIKTALGYYTSGDAMTGSISGNAGSSTYASAVTVAASTTNASFYIPFFSATTGNLAAYVATGLYFNPSTSAMTFPGAVTATSFTSAQSAAGQSLTLLEATGGSNFRTVSVPTVLAGDADLRHADALPAANQVQMYPAPTTGVSQYAWQTVYPWFVPTGPTQARTYTFADANMTIVGTTDTQTLTNKTLTAPFITNPEVDGSADIAAATIAQVSGTFFNNCTQSAASTVTLPAAAAGYSFVATVCKPALANAWKFAAYAGEYMTIDEVQGKTYVQRATTKVSGDSVTCWTGKTANQGMINLATLATGSTVTKVAHAAFQFIIAGVDYTKAVDAAGTAAMTAETTPQNKYGAHALDIGIDGTVHAVPPAASGNTTGYNDAATAVAALPAVAASHVRMGTVTAMRTNAAGFVWGTTGFNDAETTEAYLNNVVSTYGYNWNCKSGKTAWATD